MLSDDAKIILAIVIPCSFSIVLFSFALLYRNSKARQARSGRQDIRAVPYHPDTSASSCSYRHKHVPSAQSAQPLPSLQDADRRPGIGLPPHEDTIISIKSISTHPQSDKIRRVSTVASLSLSDTSPARKSSGTLPIAVVDGSRRLSIIPVAPTLAEAPLAQAWKLESERMEELTLSSFELSPAPKPGKTAAVRDSLCPRKSEEDMIGAPQPIAEVKEDADHADACSGMESYNPAATSPG